MDTERYIELDRVKSYFHAYLHRKIITTKPQEKTSKEGRTYYNVDVLDHQSNKSIARWIYCIPRGRCVYCLKDSIVERCNIDMTASYAKYYYPDHKSIMKAAKAMITDDGDSFIFSKPRDDDDEKPDSRPDECYNPDDEKKTTAEKKPTDEKKTDEKK